MVGVIIGKDNKVYTFNSSMWTTEQAVEHIRAINWEWQFWSDKLKSKLEDLEIYIVLDEDFIDLNN